DLATQAEHERAEAARAAVAAQGTGEASAQAVAASEPRGRTTAQPLLQGARERFADNPELSALLGVPGLEGAVEGAVRGAREGAQKALIGPAALIPGVEGLVVNFASNAIQIAGQKIDEAGLRARIETAIRQAITSVLLTGLTTDPGAQPQLQGAGR